MFLSKPDRLLIRFIRNEALSDKDLKLVQDRLKHHTQSVAQKLSASSSIERESFM